jgi:uncharacterized repeat protein (TIGR01451 family)
MPPRLEDDTGALEMARKRLNEASSVIQERTPLSAPNKLELQHSWEERSLENIPRRGERHVRLAGIFFITAFVFFIISLGAAVYLFYFGSNAVSVDKITIEVLGPTTIAGGDTVPLSIAVTNRNSIAIDNAIVEINFPSGTRSADGELSAYPRYTEDLGRLASGETITRSIKAVVFGSAGQALLLPISFSYRTAGSNSVFVKKSSYSLAISSTPLSVSVETLSETVSGKPLTFTLTVRSNATVPLNNVVLSAILPFGFSVTSSSIPMSESNFLLGLLSPGASKKIMLTGNLTGQGGEQRVFHFTVGTSKSANDQALAVTYMTQDATVTITTPFIFTTLALNGETRADIAIAPGSYQNATISYVNTLPTSITNATAAVTLSGSAVDYSSIQTSSGFYRSTDRTIIFSRDTDPSLAILAPGASGVGSFTFSTLPANAIGTTPSVTFTVSVSGTRVGQTNVPEEISASFVKTVKVATTVVLSASSLHFSGPFGAIGPIPPRVGQVTTYTIVWNVRNGSSSIADAIVSAVLPSYVSYNGVSTGTGSFSYDSSSRTVLWKIGDIAQGRNIQGAFQISLTPSSSQTGSTPSLTSAPTFSGHDRFAGVQINASAEPSTTDTKEDPGYVSANAFVQ